MKAQCVKHLFDLKGDPGWSDWRFQLRNAPRTLEELFALVPGLASIGGGDAVADRFRFGVTPYYLSLIERPDLDDPIVKQLLPDRRELEDPLFEDPDPLHEQRHSPVPGVIHRYPDRVLLYTTERCPLYCRFCTRKRKLLPGAVHEIDYDTVFEYLRSHPDVREVILSGGDPLSLSDRSLERVMRGIKEISHIVSVRIHTRVPVTLPMRITPELCRLFEELYPVTLVSHFNHPAEITSDAIDAIRRLRMSGVLVLNQSVLLAGVNDSVEILRTLFLSLLQAGIKPYYLHQCDEVNGVSHFRVPVSRGRELMRELWGSLPGTALPTYVIDLPDGGGKVPVGLEIEELESVRFSVSAEGE